MESSKILSQVQSQELLQTLAERFNKNRSRHSHIEWEKIKTRLESAPDKLSILNQMEITGGEPDVIAYEEASDKYIFCDCSQESPTGRRSLCYDREGLDSRKEFKPENNALDMAKSIGVELPDETQYRELQKLGNFDTKTSSWIHTPPEIRKKGGALFAEYRYGAVFVYHNGAQSYYAARGFRGIIKI